MPPTLHLLSFISLQVNVPVLSLKIHSIWQQQIKKQNRRQKINQQIKTCVSNNDDSSDPVFFLYIVGTPNSQRSHQYVDIPAPNQRSGNWFLPVLECRCPGHTWNINTLTERKKWVGVDSSCKKTTSKKNIHPVQLAPVTATVQSARAGMFMIGSVLNVIATVQQYNMQHHRCHVHFNVVVDVVGLGKIHHFHRHVQTDRNNVVEQNEKSDEQSNAFGKHRCKTGLYT